MKKILFSVLAFVILAATVAIAAEGDGPGQGVWTVRERYNYTNVTASDNTIIKASPGMLAGMVVHGGTMGAITVYDNTTCSSGTIATIASPVAGQVIPFGVNTIRGLCIRTAAAMNITVVWK
jgi:hypothetical protein